MQTFSISISLGRQLLVSIDVDKDVSGLISFSFNAGIKMIFQRYDGKIYAGVTSLKNT